MQLCRIVLIFVIENAFSVCIVTYILLTMGSFKLEFHVVLVQEYCSSSWWITFSSTCKSKFEEYFFCE